MDPSLLAAASGLGLGLSLIVAIGAQNAFVLRQGLLGRHIAVVVAICVLSDAVLIALGVGGAGAALERAPQVMGLVRLAGAAFLLGYAALAARRALRPGSLSPPDRPERTSLAATATTCLALTWLNPHVYLDTVVLLGTIANTHPGREWAFAAGAVAASTAWFVALGLGARMLRPLFARPSAWQALDAGIAVVMATLGVSLALSA
ncbi:LysE/ArgO family amino acid transporter [Motilibacter aurantiacus]|uniref:LysE/ArgO family amino acid transporter n=1 Tax=Motilibacter aurantiacus TaxID=2714955 RepID=UPI0014083566|nr:LysE family transporter [Motilibacter aurantiacus]